MLSENLNKYFQFPLEICVYGKALLQRHLGITQVYHLYQLPKRTPHIFLATFTRIYCFLHVLFAVASLVVKVANDGRGTSAGNENRQLTCHSDLGNTSDWLDYERSLFFFVCLAKRARRANVQ